MRTAIIRGIYMTAIVGTLYLLYGAFFRAETYAHDVDRLIATHPVVVFSKSYCPHSQRAKSLLDGKGTQYFAKEIETLPDYQQYLLEKTGQRTVPNVFIKRQHIGGSDKLHQLDAGGELDKLLAKVR